MLLDWLVGRKPAAVALDPAWRAHLEANVAHYRRLEAEERLSLEDSLRRFVAEKNWEGCGGLELNDEIRVTVAGVACYMVLGFPGYTFPKAKMILVYPDAYAVPLRDLRTGDEDTEPQFRAGESWSFGNVVLSWTQARAGARGEMPGHNLVIHEFAHQLDALNGSSDGVPPLGDVARERHWRKTLDREFARLVRESRRGLDGVVDPYGATNEAEFFAVASEAFFERGAELARARPQVYALLRDFYRRDPARRRPG